MKNHPVAIARASYDACVRKDRATCFKRCWPNSERISSFDYVHLVANGETVFVTYEGSNVDGGR